MDKELLWDLINIIHGMIIVVVIAVPAAQLGSQSILSVHAQVHRRQLGTELLREFVDNRVGEPDPAGEFDPIVSRAFGFLQGLELLVALLGELF